MKRRIDFRGVAVFALLVVSLPASALEPPVFTWEGAASVATGPIPGSAAGTFTGVLLAPGDQVRISAAGSVNTLPPDSGNSGGPNGNPFACTSACQLLSARFGALIGRIGPNGPWGLIGSNLVFTADRLGVLILAVNDTVHGNNTGSFTVTVNVQGPIAACEPGPGTLCLLGDRFRAQVAWRTPSGQTGAGNVAVCGADDSGLLWFFAPDNWEMLVKVIDGCGVNENFWVFMAATTNVEFTLRITDTRTGAVQQYFNPLNRLAPPLADTGAFGCIRRPGRV
jgi:hypothetical protein